jgi:hypothetical protein
MENESMKRVGYFFSSFLPVLIAAGVQFIAMFFLLGIAALFLLSGAFSSMDTIESLLTGADFSTCVMVIYSIICIVIFSQWYYHSCGGEYLPNPRRTFHPLQILGVVVLVPGMQFFSSYLVGVVSMAFPDWLRQYEELIETTGLDGDLSILMLCYSVLLAPVGEELIFRGVTLRLAQRALPFWAANLLQAFLFGFFHLNWIQGIYAFVLGLVLGYVCEKGGSIYFSLLFHVLFNFWGTVVGQLLGDIDDFAFAGLLLFGLMIVLLAVGSSLFLRGIKCKAEKLSPNDGHPSSLG